MSREKIVQIAAAENGYKEDPASSNKTKFGAWYGINGQPWCAMFVSWVYDQAGLPLGKVDSPKGYHYCPSAYNFWKANNRLTSSPQPGDIVLFDWTGDGKCDHTGIFVKWLQEGKTFQSWEGNTAVGDDSNGGVVMLRNRNKSSVKAFVNAGVIDNASFVPQPATVAKGDAGSDITILQKGLYDLGYEITVDGAFGPQTQKTLKAFQKDNGIEVTGIYDAVTKGALQAALSKPKVPDSKITTGAYLKKGAAGAAVVALQKALNKNGANPAIDEDGVFGNGTLEAVKAFQKKQGLTADGIAGPDTIGRLGIKTI